MNNSKLPPELSTILEANEKLNKEQGVSPLTTATDEEELSIGKYARLKRAKGDDTDKIVIPGASLGEQLVSAFKLSVVLPQECEYGYELLAAYAAIPSTLCNILPILELRGEPESGKSEAIKTFKAITGSVLNARSTAASIKNDINSIRWVDPSTFSIEKNCFYLLDNSDRQFFEERDVLTAFLNGYDRCSDKQSISLGKGQNQVFFVFCPKVITTIWRIESTEVRRRLLTIKFKPKMDISQVVNYRKLAINSLKKRLSDFWRTPDNWELFENFQVECEDAIPKTFSRQQWLLVTDLMAAGVTVKVWESVEVAIDFFNQYFEIRKNAKEGVYESLLISALEEISGKPRSEWGNIPKGIRIEVDPLTLRQKLETFTDAGLIPKIRAEQLQTDIRGLGFIVRPRGGKFVYAIAGK